MLPSMNILTKSAVRPLHTLQKWKKKMRQLDLRPFLLVALSFHPLLHLTNHKQCSHENTSPWSYLILYLLAFFGKVSLFAYIYLLLISSSVKTFVAQYAVPCFLEDQKSPPRWRWSNICWFQQKMAPYQTPGREGVFYAIFIVILRRGGWFLVFHIHNKFYRCLWLRYFEKSDTIYKTIRFILTSII